MRYLITLTMGTERDKFNAMMDEHATFLALLSIREKLSETLGGYTELQSRGGWLNEYEQNVEENGCQFQALTGEIDSLVEVDKLARSLASYAASALNQASVMYTFTPVTAGFVGPNEA